MANYQLHVEKRDKTGTSEVRRLRLENKVPAVVYGSGKTAISVQVDNRDLEKALASSGSLLDLDFGDESKTVIVKDLQEHPVRGSVLHVDFHEIDLTKKLETTVPVRVINEDARPSDGGVVSILFWEVTVSCLPVNIPEAITVDVSELELDSGVAVSELELPAGVEVLEDPEEVVVKVDIPREEVEEGDDELEIEGEEADDEGGESEPESSEE